MADVFLCKTGSIDNRSKAALRKAGVVVVEAENPDDCRFIKASEVLSGDDMLWAATEALRRNFGYGNTGKAQREQFAFNLIGLIDAARTADKPKTEQVDGD
jgi:hypothetical protein